jgi:6-phosphogluconolactonase (cycloisomerase 2 family)
MCARALSLSLRLVEIVDSGGSFPRGLAFASPSSLLVGGQDSASAAAFDVDVGSGKLTLKASTAGGLVTPVTFAFV